MAGKRAFLSDVWAAYGRLGDYYETSIDDIPHKSGQRRSINTWYTDGHATSVKVDPDRFKEVPEDGEMIKKLNEDTTWTNMLENP